jgi:hypothetical protein
MLDLSTWRRVDTSRSAHTHAYARGEQSLDGRLLLLLVVRQELLRLQGPGKMCVFSIDGSVQLPILSHQWTLDTPVRMF